MRLLRVAEGWRGDGWLVGVSKLVDGEVEGPTLQGFAGAAVERRRGG